MARHAPERASHTFTSPGTSKAGLPDEPEMLPDGKPAADTFLKAAQLLRVDPGRAVVIEDAISGVRAGASGHFGLVIGVARKGNAAELLHNGAHVVVNDLSELVD